MLLINAAEHAFIAQCSGAACRRREHLGSRCHVRLLINASVFARALVSVAVMLCPLWLSLPLLLSHSHDQPLHVHMDS